MYFKIFFVLNRVRVSNPQRLTYTQIWVEYPPPQGENINTTLIELQQRRVAAVDSCFAHLRAHQYGIARWRKCLCTLLKALNEDARPPDHAPSDHASSQCDSKLTMIDSKSTNQNASSAGGRSQNLRLAEERFSGRQFFSCFPRPVPVALSPASDRFSRASKMAPAIANSAFSGIFPR